MSEEATPSLTSAIVSAIESRLRQLHTWQPGIIISYSDATQTASVQPSVKIAIRNQSNTRIVRSIPPLNHVPVVFVGSGGRRIKLPVSRGDEVILMFCETSLDIWKYNGGEVDPKDDRHHSVSDAIAIIGLQHKASNKTPIIEFTTSNQIHAGGSSQLATKADLDALRTWVAAQFAGAGHVHAVSGSTTTAVTPVPAPSPTPPVSAGTQILKGS